MKTENGLRIAALFFAILLSGGQIYYPRVLFISIFLVLMLVNRIGSDWKIDRRLAVPALLVGVVMIIELFRPASELGQWGVRMVNFAAGLMLLNMYLYRGQDRFQRDLFAITRFMPYQALGTVVLYAAAPDIFRPIGTPDPIGGQVGMTFGYLFNYHGVEALDLVRPDGFFWEPGVFHIYLGLNLIICLWGKKSHWSALMSILAILSTQSTTGVIGLSLILAYYIFDTTRVKGIENNLWQIALMVALLIPVAFVTSNNIEEKMTGDRRGSYYARNYDTIAGLNIVSNHPAFGIGFSLDEYLIESRIDPVSLAEYSESAFEERQGSTNGIVILLFSMGIPLGLAFIIGIVRQRLLAPRPLIAIFLMLSLSSEALTLFPFFLMITFSGLIRTASHRAAQTQPRLA